MIRRGYFLPLLLILALLLAACGGGGGEQAAEDSSLRGGAAEETDRMGDLTTPPAGTPTDGQGTASGDFPNVPMPLPEGAREVDRLPPGEGGGWYAVNYEVPNMSGEELYDFYLTELPAAGYDLDDIDEAGEENNTRIEFEGHDVMGVIDIADATDEGSGIAFRIMINSPELVD